MDGLECSEILLSDIDLGDRIDAEYFSKQYLEIEKRLSFVKTRKIGELSSAVASAFYPAATQLYSIGDTAFIRCVDCVSYPVISTDQDAQFEKIPYSFAKQNSGISLLKQHEIVITKVGTPCYASVLEGYDEVALSRTVLGLTQIKTVDPYYLMTFLRCKYGFGQLYRQRELTIQYQLTLPRVKAVDVFLPSNAFQSSIVTLVKQYEHYMHTSVRHYRNAMSILMSNISSNLTLNESGVSVKTFSTSYAITGRLDAEYYQPKYESIQRALNAKDTVRTLCKLHDKTFLPKPNEEYRYIELADVGTSGFIADVESQRGVDLPTRARRKVKRGQVIVSSVEGSLQSCALITDEYDNALCSTGFYVVDSAKINPETLLVLFKSEPIQALMKQRCSGTILTAISKDEFLSMPLPFIGDDVQSEIARKVQESFSLRRQAEKLIETAVRAVEIAIEQDEAAAVAWQKSVMDF